MNIGDKVKPKYNYYKQLRGTVKDIVQGIFFETMVEVEWENGRFPRCVEMNELEVVNELQVDDGASEIG